MTLSPVCWAWGPEMLSPDCCVWSRGPSAGQAASRVRPGCRWKVEGEEQGAAFLVFLQRLAQPLPLLCQCPDLPPQSCVLLLQALVLLGGQGCLLEPPQPLPASEPLLGSSEDWELL